MIWESHYWKKSLLKTADDIRSMKNATAWSDARFAKFEQFVMLGFYSVRKLIEAENFRQRRWKQV